MSHADLRSAYWRAWRCGCSRTNTGPDRPRRRARHALARTVTQYAARSWLPVASTIRACTHGNRSAGGTGAPCGQHNPRVCARSNLRASSATSLAFKHNPRVCAHSNRTGPANPPLGTSTIREFAHTATLGCGDSDTTAVAQSTLLRTQQPHRSRQSAACHQHNPHICAHSNLRASSASSLAFKHNPRACTQATAPVPPIRCLPSAQSAHLRAQQREQLVDGASGDAVRPAHLHARQQPTTSPRTLSRRASGCPQHSSPATPTRLVHEDALCFLARLEKRIFSLGAGDRHGRDLQAD